MLEESQSNQKSPTGPNTAPVTFDIDRNRGQFVRTVSSKGEVISSPMNPDHQDESPRYTWQEKRYGSEKDLLTIGNALVRARLEFERRQTHIDTQKEFGLAA